MPTDISFQTVFDLLQKQNSSVNELWKFYSTVALALLAAAVGSDKLKATKLGVAVVLVGFWMFSLGNLVVLLEGQQLTIQLGAIANELANKTAALSSVRISTTPIWQMAVFHLVCDAALTLAIVVVAKNSWAKAPPPHAAASQETPDN